MQLNIDSIDYSKTLGPSIGKTFKMIEDFMDNILAANDIFISKKQWLVLNLIKSNNGINQNDLANFTNRDKTSITRFINNLEKKQFIERQCSTEDKRVKILFLTKKGEETLAKATPIIRQAIFEIQNEISDSEIENAIKSLNKIQEKINHLQKIK